MIILILGAVAIFIWSKLSPTMPTEKTELLESPLPEPTDILDTLKTGAAKVAGIVGGGAGAVKVAAGAAKIVPSGLPAITAKSISMAAFVPAAIPVVALPAATVLPAGLSAMAPTTLTSAVYGTTPAVVGTGTGTASVGAGAGGAAGAGTALAGAALAAAPIVIVPIFAKILDAIWPKHVVTESEQAAMDAAHAFRAEVAALPGVQLIKGQHDI